MLVPTEPSNSALVNDACGRRSRAYFSAAQRGRYTALDATWDLRCDDRYRPIPLKNSSARLLD